MSAVTRCSYLLLLLFIHSTKLRQINDTIARLIPERIKKSNICLVNTNMTFNVPASRFHGKNGTFWKNPGKARVMPDLYIIDLSNGDLENVLFDLHSNMLFQPKATYLLVTKEVNKKSLLNALHKFFIVEAFAVTPNGNTYRFDRKRFNMFPIRKRDIVFQELARARLRDFTNITLRVGFMRKPPFVICPECSTEKGVETEVFDMAVRYMNIKVEYVQYRTEYWGEKLQGGYTFLYKEIFDRRFDVGFGQTFDFDDCHYDFDLSPIHIIDPMQFVVPKARRIKRFNLFSYVFKKETLLLYVVILTLIFLMISILNRWGNKLETFMELVHVTFEVSFAMHHINRSSVRCLYAFFMFSIIIFNTGLKSKLFWTLTMDHFEYQINSLEDIIHSDLIPVFNNRTEGYFDRDNPIDRFMETNSPRTCGFDLACVDMVAFHRNVTTMKMKKTLEYYSPRRYVDRKGRALMHIINVDIQKIYLRFFFIKGHPAFPRFSKIVKILLENGINNYISKKLTDDNRKAQAKAEMNHHAISVHKLKISQLLNVVYFYIGGIILSVLVFCVELAWH